MREFLWADRFFWIAVILCIALQAYPDTRWLLWPIKQFGVYVHELFHGLSAVASGGSFELMRLYADGGGVAYTVTYGPFSRVFVSAGGLLGPSLLGGVILFFSRRFRLTDYLLRGLAALIVLSVVLWVRDWPTALFCGAWAIALGVISLVPSRTFVRIFAQYLGIQLCVENLIDFNYMFTEGFTRDGKIYNSDTANIAEVIGGAYWLWGLIIAALTLAIIAVSLVKSRPSHPTVTVDP